MAVMGESTLQTKTPPLEPRPIIRWLTYTYVLAQGVILAFVLGGLIHTFVATPFRISGISMEPNFVDGQFLLVDKLSYLIGRPNRGDVVVLRFPANPTKKLFIKRIVGLPGETILIRAGRVEVNNVPLTEAFRPSGSPPTEPEQVRVLAFDEYFVLGDNRPNSNDSRFWGQLPREDIIGLARFSLSPSLFGWIAQPAF